MIVSVVGARPQFVKAAVVSRALHGVGVQEQIVHTGQHYDAKMSSVFWDELGIPETATNLDVGSDRPGRQTGRMVERLEEFLLTCGENVQGVLLYGDTNSTLAGAIAAAQAGLPSYHVEAGLRSGNRAMPEEINRLVADRLAHALFCPSASSLAALAAEGITDRVYCVGDVMLDALTSFSDVARNRYDLTDLLPFRSTSYLVVTIHRQSNTAEIGDLQRILCAIGRLNIDALWPVHPRVAGRLADLQVPSNVHAVEPLSYLEMLAVLQGAAAVITDSGGLQKEAYWLQKPCITVRSETEWIETLNGGWNQVVGTGPDAIVEAFHSPPTGEWQPLYGDGHAADKIATVLANMP